jgi:Zn-dependent protease
MLSNPQVFLVTSLFLVPAAFVAIPVHELAHALAAYVQGDRSVRYRGLFNPDPRRFIEPYGLVAVFLARVGWGMPIPVNEQRLRGAGGQVAYALAGPVGNLLVAVVFGIVLRILLANHVLFEPASLVQTPLGYVAYVVYAIYFLNLSFFAFNLLPLPGLDGWRVLEALFRRRNPRFFFNAAMRRRDIWGIAVLAIFITSFLGIPLLSSVMLPFYAPASTVIFGTCLGYPGLQPCPL